MSQYKKYRFNALFKISTMCINENNVWPSTSKVKAKKIMRIKGKIKKMSKKKTGKDKIRIFPNFSERLYK
jgi:hypothetical protein